jgi:simple sugar transport system ATP-binding protein
VDTVARAAVTSKHDLARRMVGREVLLEIERSEAPLGEAVLELEGLAGNGLDGLDLTLRRGEIVAVVGVAGNGRRPWWTPSPGWRPRLRARCAYRAASGPILPRPAVERRRGAHPEDRLGGATCPELDLVDNVLLTTRKGFAPGLFLDKKSALGATRAIIRRFHVAAHGPEVRARQLSGGNLKSWCWAASSSASPGSSWPSSPARGWTWPPPRRSGTGCSTRACRPGAAGHRRPERGPATGRPRSGDVPRAVHGRADVAKARTWKK